MRSLAKILFISYVIAFVLSGCRAPEKLSQKYYHDHQSELQQINAAYNSLCNKQAFILNFTDDRYKKYSLEVSTDSIRYVYNTSVMKFSVADSIAGFGLDGKEIKKLGQKMIDSKCICVARHSFYFNDHEFTANWLFFKQVHSGMFKESRYHVLIFFNEPLTADVRKEFIERRELVQLENNVFYTVSNRFK